MRLIGLAQPYHNMCLLFGIHVLSVMSFKNVENHYFCTMVNETDIKDYLRERSLKVTPIRMELLTLLANHGVALPYSEIQKQLKSFDRVTLYRTINALMDNGIVHKASTSGDETYYALCSQQCSKHCHKHEHIHFKCTQCGEVSCVHIEQAFNISLPNYQIDDVSIEVTGVCKKCVGRA